MKNAGRFIIFNNVKLPINASLEEAFSVARARAKRLGLPRDLEYSVYRRSVDARKRNSIQFVYSIAARGEIPTLCESVLKAQDASVVIPESVTATYGRSTLTAPPVIVGSGPCGLFAGLILAENGYRPVIIERGGSVKERIAATERLINERRLDIDTNVQFGAGGAGTFSDGKLVTRINDPLTSYVLEKFIAHGAPDDIRFIAKPHIGTDVLSGIVESIIERIVSLGGRIEYHTRFECTRHDNAGRVYAVHTNRGDIPSGAVILAVGHSARDTYMHLMSSGVITEAKAFSVGMRIEHLTKDIDRALYGDYAGNPVLGHAEYNLSNDTKSRGVYTFCMCPGGVVVPATSELYGVVVNGMSESSRGGVNSNSAVVCSIFKEDYGSTPLKAIDFQRKIEREAFRAGGGDYSAPIITVGDFLSDRLSAEPGRIKPSYMNGGVRLARPESYLPRTVTDSIKRALTAFDKKINGFAAPDAILTGAETRTSAPIRITRDPQTRLAPGYTNFYPAGEGAGYAGGITSAAIDGIRTALALMNNYKPIDICR